MTGLIEEGGVDDESFHIDVESFVLFFDREGENGSYFSVGIVFFREASIGFNLIFDGFIDHEFSGKVEEGE